MGGRAWTRLSKKEREEVWKRWRTGEQIADIATALSRAEHSVARELDYTGGIPPRQRRRAARVFALREREEISRGLSVGESMRSIARRLGRAASSVSREIRRHGGRAWYRAARADARAWERARRPQRCVLAMHPRLRDQVAQWLQLQWSPEQISRRLVAHYPDDHSMRVSHETIYRTLFVQARGALKKELLAHLRTQRSRRRPRHADKPVGGSLRGELSISQRPAEAADRAVPGHWEGDLLCGSKGSQIATLVERRSRFVMLVKVADKNSVHVADALAQHVRRLPEELRRTLTWDRGIEMAAHVRFTLATQMQVYFCDPYSPWQRGSNENTNGLLRQYFPKRTDLSVHSQAHLDMIADRLNGRPRKTLDWRNPAEAFTATVVASTG
jgi:IS30 family transposase